ncbi:hypothetical protein EJ08DRAFT_738183 [Tothia fuscella]|uniref:JmjC domain-containing protein n=1 Tax=Tothia fuscella TaxID=1048955 RepID=A0A9P4NHP3_9PEZI|nr:hypothetical protein EJ08DRAFT_738183 [Tothia fuscella]
MPANRPRASFEPIAPDFDLRELVETTENFQYVDRISCETIEEQGLENFEKLILLHVIIGGKPLVVDGWEDRLDPWTFTPKWLRDNHGDKVENARNLHNKDSLTLTVGHYLNYMGKLTDQYWEKPDNYKDKQRQRSYLKDIDCPPVWQEKLKEHIPASLFYWNDSTGEVGGPGAIDEPLPNGAGRRKGKGVASAGDLMSSLPMEMRAENLMCYIGHEGTYTPAHREMCASLGQNIMVNASESFGENGQPEKPGSSIWFMTESKDRHTVAEYWLSVLGHDIEIEDHFAQVVAWQKAPFKVYVVEQKAGDFILIPPLAPHQVWNRGTRTMKVAWNRTTVETLELAMNEALPNARLVCRDEQYKNKAIIYYTLLKYSGLLKTARMQANRSEWEARAIHSSKKVRQVQKDFKRLFKLYKNILLSESFALGTKETCEFLAFDSNVTCAYCRGNIFNRFLSCKTCMDMLNTGTDEPYDVCMDCFAMGRSCACQSKYKWVEQFKWKELVARYDEWRQQIIDMDGGLMATTPQSLEEEREIYTKKTTAVVCQEQLKLRPWVDVKQPKPESEEDEEEIQVDDNGQVKKTIKKKSKSWLENNKSCHVCLKKHPKWMMANCTMCERGWCYGSLWRAHDLMPQTVMEDPNWECPHCRRVCSTGACRKDKRQKPYEPKGTLLGHDTKKVADVRSVEALIDFGRSNLSWLKDATNGGAPESSARIEKKRLEAEMAKLHEPSLDEHYADEDEGIVLDDGRGEIEYSPVDDMIDPALGGGGQSMWRPESQLDDSMLNVMSGANGFDAPENGVYPEPDYPNDGHMAPAAMMYQPADGLMMDGTPTFAGSSRKRPRPGDEEQIKLVSSKKRKTEEDRPLPKNKASKQYQTAQENKRLEEAKKAGRFIQVLASIRGRKKIVKLKVIKEKLADFAIKEARRAKAQQPGAQADASQNMVLQSDIAPPKTFGAAPVKINGKKASNKVVRIRVEEDKDFTTRERSDRRKPGVSQNKPRFEEIEVESDFDEDFEGDIVGGETSQQRKEARRSSWLARKRAPGDEDLPDELPADFRDGDANPRREELRAKGKERRATMPARPPLGLKAPKLKPARASTGGVNENGEARGRGRPPKTKVDPVAMAKAAMLEDENRRAKIEAAGIIGDDSVSGSESDSFKSAEDGAQEKEPEKVKAVPTKGGLADRATKGGPADRLGKKVKIVGVKKSGPGPGKSSYKPAAAVVISTDASSDDESTEGEIAPGPNVRKGPPGRRTLPTVGAK